MGLFSYGLVSEISAFLEQKSGFCEMRTQSRPRMLNSDSDVLKWTPSGLVHAVQILVIPDQFSRSIESTPASHHAVC